MLEFSTNSLSYLELFRGFEQQKERRGNATYLRFLGTDEVMIHKIDTTGNENIGSSLFGMERLLIAHTDDDVKVRKVALDWIGTSG